MQARSRPLASRRSPRARPRALDLRPASLGQRLLRLFPRRALFHRLRPASRLGLHRPAAADADDRLGVGPSVSLAQGFATRSGGGVRGDSCADRCGRAHARRRTLRPVACGARGSGGRGAAALRCDSDDRLAAAARLARDRALRRQGGAGRRADLAFGFAGAIGGVAFLAKYTVALLPRFAWRSASGEAAAPAVRALAALGRRGPHARHRRPEPHLAGGERLAVRRPHRRAGGAKEHLRSRRARSSRRKF